jgi:hypothetical protein
MLRSIRMRSKLFIVILGIISCMIVITGCSPSEDKKIQFETIEQQEWPGYPDKDIHLVIISSKNEVGGIDAWVSEDAQNKLIELDYSNFFALTVFQGIKPTNRYSIEITNVTRTNNTINLETSVHNRDPDLEAADVQTSPYHSISIEKVGDWNEDFAFNLIQSGIIITSTTHFIP